MTSELLHMIALGRVVHPTVPSFANMFSHPDVVHVPIGDMPPLRSALVWCAGDREPRVQDFARIAAEVAGRPDDVRQGVAAR